MEGAVMKRHFSMISFIMLISFFTASFNPLNTGKSYQPNLSTITASGQWCGAGSCYPISFSFNPAGGPISGSANGTVRNYDTAGSLVNVEVYNANLSGTFQGGDGGGISGTMTGTASYTCPTCDPPEGSRSLDGWTWGGTLFANGTGNGALFVNLSGGGDVPWNVTFSSQQFQEALGVPASPEVESTQSSEPETQVTLEAPASPTIISTQTNPTQPIPVLPVIQTAAQSWPTVDIAAEDILNQDGAIIARDAKGVFYVVSNEGVRKPLPDELQDRVSQELFFLWNADLLNASPAIKALVAMDSIASSDDITGANKYFEIPLWLKDRDYLKMNTDCTDETCRSMILIPTMLGISLDLDADGLAPGDLDLLVVQVSASSEHSSVRGTINGGGDFISAPQAPQSIFFASLVMAIKPHLLVDNGTTPYLGLQTNNDNNKEIVRLVQKGSPAEKTGLAVGDVVLKVNKIAVDAKNTLASLINQHHGGDQVELEITRNGDPLSFTVKLAQILPPILTTSAAEITYGENTNLVIDIGFNGINGIYVREGQALVRELITGSEVIVQPGYAVIVVPGYPIEAPLLLKNDQIHDSFPKTSQPSQSSPAGGTIEFPLWYLIAFVAVVILLIVVLVVFLRRKARRAKEKIIPPEPSKKISRVAGKK
jgi:hypothetical protein